MKLLIFTDWYTPAYKAGGPVRSIVNLVDFLKSSHDVFVFTADRDLNDKNSLPGITANIWQMKDGVSLYYYSAGQMTFSLVKKTISLVQPDRIYINSMFSNMFKPIWAGYLSNKLIIAPRGMLNPSALSIKPLKKYFYLWFLRVWGIEKHLIFHATGIAEVDHIRQVFPHAGAVFIAPNIPVRVSSGLLPVYKKSGTIKLLFAARLHPIKNLLFLLKALKGMQGDIEMDIVITREDLQYFDQCRQFGAGIGDNIQLNWKYDLTNQQVLECMSKAHLFVLPSLGENFGHAIYEALSVGCPVLISDQTPWKNLLIQHAGMDLPLQEDLFREGIARFIAQDNQAWQQFRDGAWNLARRYVCEMNLNLDYNNLFGIHEG